MMSRRANAVSVALLVGVFVAGCDATGSKPAQPEPKPREERPLNESLGLIWETELFPAADGTMYVVTENGIWHIVEEEAVRVTEVENFSDAVQARRPATREKQLSCLLHLERKKSRERRDSLAEDY